ncbi:hypothetical protein GW796_09250 [archaeon]|nr:hypothetical protein [archaeon]PJB17000.1 MAG: hypothetical protein CO117_13310 [Flavobacteriaceae bacterium CG_4_9_14_3_um_filter_33_16]
MKKENKIVFVMAQIALMNCERAGMEAENTYRLNCGQSIIYGDEAFQSLYDKYAPLIGRNAFPEMFILSERET